MTKNELVRTYLEKAAKRRQKSKPRIRPSPDKSGSHEGNGIRSRGSPAAPGESLDTGSREEGGTRSRGSPAVPGDSLDTQPSPDGGSGLLSSRRMMSSLAINRAPTREMVSAVVGARLCRAMTVATESCSYA